MQNVYHRSIVWMQIVFLEFIFKSTENAVVLRNSQWDPFVKKKSTGFSGKCTGVEVWKSCYLVLMCDLELALETSVSLISAKGRLGLTSATVPGAGQ